MEKEMMNANHVLEKFPAKVARDLIVGDIIVEEFGFTLKVREIVSHNSIGLKLIVEHQPEENEYYNGNDCHEENFLVDDIVGIGKVHGGFC
jgi:hypothetical protein